ncbi:DNA repair protein RecO [Limibacillus halophilus]|uniref:DNA repair protein RecO n=1 Tax=Limibacillus halophilus TaxID=1579333 RepID=A0A839STZ2_9PROT|nr:DNA repair protein RecO [Limibacillus halophilus]MBB3064445.1 DNA repair protein RecO (recombination protein O) [Limibacillus halophilus]
MIEWRDEGYLLAIRPHGEDAAVVQLLTLERGRHAGLVRGGQGRRLAGVLQIGNRLRVDWRARLADHLGMMQVELVEANAARFLHDPARLGALTSAAAICERALPEREAHPACFHGFAALLEALDGDHWAEIYVRWELAVLADLGFGLDLGSCAATGSEEGLIYVSPRSGRAVSEGAGAVYKDKLLRLPGFLTGQGSGGVAEVAAGLALSGYFLEKRVFHPQDRPLPSARQRLASRFPIDSQEDGN